MKRTHLAAPGTARPASAAGGLATRARARDARRHGRIAGIWGFSHNRYKGFNLVELSVVLAVLGIIAVLGWRLTASVAGRVAENEAADRLRAVDEAIVGFAAARGRLPCPDTNRDGGEDCAGAAAIGALPWATLGLADPGLARLRYGVHRAAAGLGWTDRDLAVARDRFRPLLAAGVPPQGLESLLDNVTGLDFCDALRRATDDPAGAGGVDVVAGGVRVPVAYAVAEPGAGGAFDGANREASAFAAPTTPRGAGYDDGVVARSFTQLFDRLGCGGLLASAGHAHANVASSTSILAAGLTDYKRQLELADRMADAYIVDSTAKVAAAAGGTAMAGATALIAAAQALISQGTASALLIPAAAAVTANVVATAAAGATVGLAAAKKVQTSTKLAEFEPLLTDGLQLAAEVRIDAGIADALETY